MKAIIAHIVLDASIKLTNEVSYHQGPPSRVAQRDIAGLKYLFHTLNAKGQDISWDLLGHFELYFLVHNNDTEALTSKKLFGTTILWTTAIIHLPLTTWFGRGWSLSNK